MIDVVSQEKDWAAIWRDSNEHAEVVAELDEISKGTSESSEKGDDNQQADNHKYASSQLYQNKIVLRRANVQVSLARFRLSRAHHFIQLWRQVDYVTSKVALHLIAALFNGFSFYMIGSRYRDLQARVFSIFIFVFVRLRCFIMVLR